MAVNFYGDGTPLSDIVTLLYTGSVAGVTSFSVQGGQRYAFGKARPSMSISRVHASDLISRYPGSFTYASAPVASPVLVSDDAEIP